MADPAKRLDAALRVLRGAEWDDFERLCSTFLSADFPDLRTIAGTGDLGRDAVLESPEHPGVVLQFSIEQDPKSKIMKTIDRLDEANVPFTMLVFATNQDFGTRADAVQAELMKRGTGLLVRDRRWFVDRAMSSPARIRASEALAQRVIDPIEIAPPAYGTRALEDTDLRAGLLYLELQIRDSETDRNLTKLTFDGLVMSVLSGADTEHRVRKADVVSRVGRLVPNQERHQVRASVLGSLDRLQRQRRIVYTGAEESYALHRTERLRLAERVVEMADAHAAAQTQLAGVVRTAADDLEIPMQGDAPEALVAAIDEVIHRTLEDNGNQFAEAVRTRGTALRRSDVYGFAEIVGAARYTTLRTLRLPPKAVAELITEAVTRCFVVPSGQLQTYMREMADAYTLLAFMREAEDVNRAVSHFFGQGKLILDATVLLPLIPETLLRSDDQRFSNLLRAAKAAGMELYVSEGVLNEVLTHLGRCIACLQTDPAEWQGSIPLVLAEWRALSGSGDFRAFVDAFRTRDASTDRVEMFLQEHIGAVRIELDPVAEGLDVAIRGRITEIWRPRKRIKPTESEMQRDILLRHDVSMYAAVLAMRTSEDRKDVRGFESWWLTGDRTAFRMRQLLSEEGIDLDSDPCMSPAFLSNLLAVGPSSNRLTSDARMSVPAALDVQRWTYGAGELAALADEIRDSQARDPQWLLRSKARETMNSVKARRTVMALSDAPTVSEAGQEDDGLDSEG